MKISVVIPAYNAQSTIEACLISLKNQTFKDFEIVVVDDGSSDNTADIASQYARVVKPGVNKGEGAARNAGAKALSGEILAFTDADVVVPPGWLERIVKDMEQQKARCVGGGYSGSIGASFMECFEFQELAFRRRNMPEFVSTIVSNNFACDREVFFECGGFPEGFKCEDLRLSFKISQKYPIFWDKENGVLHHFRPSFMGYLKQQFYFGRDTVFSYYQMPELFKVKTHQGRVIYIEVFLIFLCLISLFFSRFLFLAMFWLWLLMQFPFMIFLNQQRVSLLKALAVTLLRDLVCVFSIFAGLWLCVKDQLRNFRSINR